MEYCRMRNLQKEDKRKVIFLLLESACENLPDYSAGEILYTALRSLGKEHDQSFSFLRTLTDEELFRDIEFRLFEESLK